MNLKQAAQVALSAIEDGVSFNHLDNVVAPILRKALEAPEQDPVATWENKYGMKEWEVHAIRAGWMPSPPQRKWIGLTDEECQKFLGGDAYGATIHDIRAIEAKLKEKNT